MFACIYIPGAPASVELAYSFSPRVEETAPDAVVVDLEGCAHLFGSDSEIAAKIAERAAAAQIALAANPDAAFYAARGFPGVTIIPAGKEAQVLGPLPVQTLSPSPEIAETLHTWGIRTLRDLAALPEGSLSERLGAEGLRLRTLARGEADRALILSTPAPGFEKSQELEYPVALLEPLSFILASLLNQICRNLETHSLATTELRLTLGLEDKSEHERTLRLPVPMRDNKAFLRLMQLDLELHPPGAPVIAVSLRAKPAKPRVLQEGLFIPLAPEPQKLELTLARIAHVVGPENVGSAEVLNTHRPDAFVMKKFYGA